MSYYLAREWFAWRPVRAFAGVDRRGKPVFRWVWLQDVWAIYWPRLGWSYRLFRGPTPTLEDDDV